MRCERGRTQKQILLHVRLTLYPLQQTRPQNLIQGSDNLLTFLLFLFCPLLMQKNCPNPHIPQISPGQMKSHSKNGSFKLFLPRGPRNQQSSTVHETVCPLCSNP